MPSLANHKDVKITDSFRFAPCNKTSAVIKQLGLISSQSSIGSSFADCLAGNSPAIYVIRRAQTVTTTKVDSSIFTGILSMKYTSSGREISLNLSRTKHMAKPEYYLSPYL